MGYIDVLLLFSSLPWHLVVVLAVVARSVGCAVDRYQGHLRSLLLHMALLYAYSQSSAGECKATCLAGLALAWYAAESLC